MTVEIYGFGLVYDTDPEHWWKCETVRPGGCAIELNEVDEDGDALGCDEPAEFGWRVPNGGATLCRRHSLQAGRPPEPDEPPFEMFPEGWHEWARIVRSSLPEARDVWVGSGAHFEFDRPIAGPQDAVRHRSEEVLGFRAEAGDSDYEDLRWRNLDANTWALEIR